MMIGHRSLAETYANDVLSDVLYGAVWTQLVYRVGLVERDYLPVFVSTSIFSAHSVFTTDMRDKNDPKQTVNH